MKTTPLVTCEWLAEHRQDPDIAILDATWYLPTQPLDTRNAYASRHVPGARYFDIDAIADHATALPHMLPSAAEFGAAVGTMGIDNNARVIVYDANAFMASARVWWTFRVFGHDAVWVLDGGLRRWLALGLPASSSPDATLSAVEFQADYRPGLVRHRTELQNVLADSAWTVLDARPPGRFAGREAEPRPGLRSGHMPGSRNVFFKTLIDESTGCLHPPDTLAETFRAAGLEEPTAACVTTCGSGVTAAVLTLALARLGNWDAALYDGAWAEWGADGSLPIATF